MADTAEASEVQEETAWGPKWEFPLNRAIFGGLYNQAHSILGSIIGPLILETPKLDRVVQVASPGFEIPVLLECCVAELLLKLGTRWRPCTCCEVESQVEQCMCEHMRVYTYTCKMHRFMNVYIYIYTTVGKICKDSNMST